jgi:hypothetical protein
MTHRCGPALVLVAAVFAALCHEPAVAVKVESESGVLVLSEENFDVVLKKARIVFVAFYDPANSEFKKNLPSFEKAARSLKKADAEGTSIRVAKMDGTTEFGAKAFSSKVPGATSSPRKRAQFVAFEDGKFSSIYTGAQEKDEFVAFASALAGNPQMKQFWIFWNDFKFTYKTYVRMTPLGKNGRQFAYTAFPAVLVLLAISPLLLWGCFKCCCGGSQPENVSKADVVAKEKKGKPTEETGAKKRASSPGAKAKTKEEMAAKEEDKKEM